MLPKLISSKKFIVTVFTIIISFSTLFWIITTNNNPFNSFTMNNMVNNKQNSLSLDKAKDDDTDAEDYYLRGSTLLEI